MAITDQMPMPQGAAAPMPGGAPAAGAAPMPGGPDDTGVSTDGGAPPDQNEQNAYDNVVVEAVERIDKQAPQIIKMIQGAQGDKAEEAGKIVAMLMIKMDEEAGGDIPDDVVIPAAAEVGEQLAERLQAAGMPVDNAFLQRGAMRMMADLGEHYGVDPEDVEDLMGSVPPEQAQGYHDEMASFYSPEDFAAPASPDGAMPAPAPAQGAAAPPPGDM